MKARQLNRHNYQKDTLYLHVTQVIDSLLDDAQIVIPSDVFQQLGMLTPQSITKWKQGQTPSLEQVIHCNLSKAKRILTIIKLYAIELELRPVLHRYRRKGKSGSHINLRFSKYGKAHIERLYSTHYVGKRP